MMKLTSEEREGMRETLLVFGMKSPEYYDKCTDEQLEQEYNRLTAAADGGGRK